MFNSAKSRKANTQLTEERNQLQYLINAIDRSMATIEFDLDGYIIKANENFLNSVGYTFNDLKGQHHGIFCDPSYKESQEYKNFWRNLNTGEFVSGRFKRIKKNKDTLWLEASYNPVLMMTENC